MHLVARLLVRFVMRLFVRFTKNHTSDVFKAYVGNVWYLASICINMNSYEILFLREW